MKFISSKNMMYINIHFRNTTDPRPSNNNCVYIYIYIYLYIYVYKCDLAWHLFKNMKAASCHHDTRTNLTNVLVVPEMMGANGSVVEYFIDVEGIMFNDVQ